MMGFFLMLLLAAAVAQPPVLPIEIIQQDDGSFAFSPRYTNVPPDTTLVFTWPALPSNDLFRVKSANASEQCSILPLGSVPFAFECAPSSPAQRSCKVYLNDTVWPRRAMYAFRGFTAAKPDLCFTGAVIVGAQDPYHCAQATTRQACQALIPTQVEPGERSRYGACEWCGFGNNTDFSGFCFAPSWAGQSSCPFFNNIRDYQCPPDAFGFYCASACWVNSTQPCADFQVPFGSATP